MLFLGAIDASNSVVATLFQFSAPIIVVSYISLKMKELPPRNQVIGIIGTLIGLFLLLTNGTLDSLLVSTKAIIFGIGLGFTYAFYTLYPARLMKEWGDFNNTRLGNVYRRICYWSSYSNMEFE